MMHGDVYCNHCEMQADACDCGVDRELAWREHHHEPTAPLPWVLIAVGLGVVLLLALA